MSKPLASAAASAKQSGLSNSSGPADLKQSCPLAESGGAGSSGALPGVTNSPSGSEEAHQYEECVLQQLLVEINDNGRAQKYALNAQRRQEPVQVKTPDDYKRSLKAFDLIVEALSAIDIGKTGSHLRVKAQAFNSSRHSSFQPLHPRTEVGFRDAADNGGIVNTQVPTPYRDHLQSWLSIWPFSEDRTVYAPINAKACGRLKSATSQAGPPPLKELAIQLVVFPQEEWTFSIEGDKGRGKTKTWTGDVKRQGEKDAHVWLSRTVTTKLEKDGASNTVSTTTRSAKSFTSTTETQVNADESSSSYKSTVKGDTYRSDSLTSIDAEGHGESITETTNNGEYSETIGFSQERKAPHSIGSRTYSVSQTDSTDKGVTPLSDKVRYKVDDIFSLEVKSGGETSKFEPSKFVEDIYKIADIFKDVGKIFDIVKLGWSYSYDYTLFQGVFNLGWGLRWPNSYQENGRVYYVERFVTASGDLKLAEGSISASLGLEFDKGWLPAGIVALVSVSLKASLQVSPKINIVYTNWRDGLQDIEREVAGNFEITLSGSAVGSARVCGFSRVIKGTADAKFAASAKMALSTQRPPSLKAGVNFDGLILNGYFESSASEPRRVPMEPRVLLEPGVVMEEREFWS